MPVGAPVGAQEGMVDDAERRLADAATVVMACTVTAFGVAGLYGLVTNHGPDPRVFAVVFLCEVLTAALVR